MGKYFQVGVNKGDIQPQLIFVRYPPSPDHIKCLPIQLNKKANSRPSGHTTISRPERFRFPKKISIPDRQVRENQLPIYILTPIRSWPTPSPLFHKAECG